jgi:hypothetical protein
VVSFLVSGTSAVPRARAPRRHPSPLSNEPLLGRESLWAPRRPPVTRACGLNSIPVSERISERCGDPVVSNDDAPALRPHGSNGSPQPLSDEPLRGLESRGAGLTPPRVPPPPRAMSLSASRSLPGALCARPIDLLADLEDACGRERDFCGRPLDYPPAGMRQPSSRSLPGQVFAARHRRGSQD